MDEYGSTITVLCDNQEAEPVCSGQYAFTKRSADTAIGGSPCVTSIPSDMPRAFIKSCFLLFRDHYRVDLPLCQDVRGRPGGGDSWRPIWQRVWTSSIRYPKLDRPTIFPRGTFWRWCFKRLQSGRRYWPCQESGAWGWLWHGTRPLESSFGWHSWWLHTVWGTDMGGGMESIAVLW